MSYRLKSYEFRREREAGWRELEGLLARAEKSGIESLSADELYRLPALYRAALSSLSVARAISLDRALIDYLESLSSRAYLVVYGSEKDYLGALVRFFTHRFPSLVRRHASALAVSGLLMLAGLATGYLVTLQHPELYYSLVSEEIAQGRSPASSREELRAVLRNLPPPAAGDQEEQGEEAPLTIFATFLFTHNSRVGMLCFALGFAAGLPVALLLFSNGALLGAMAAVHQQHDLGVAFWGWILPHGVTELLAVCLCGAAGLLIGRAVVFPGRLTRRDALAAAGREAAEIVAGTIALFLIAGLIEGYFRQLVSADLPRYLLALATAAFWWRYFSRAGRGAASGSGTATGAVASGQGRVEAARRIAGTAATGGPR